MNPRFLILAGLLLGCPVLAAAQTQTSPTASDLDLSLPKSATDHRNDPPGTWYGDTSGVPASTTKAASAPRRYSACPTTPDGKDTDLTGSVSAGIGYSNRGGNSNYQAARVNYCKEYATDSGDSRVLNISVGVSQSSGPDGYYGGGWGPYYAPRPMGGMRPR